jgi:hypothetical protein
MFEVFHTHKKTVRREEIEEVSFLSNRNRCKIYRILGNIKGNLLHSSVG